MKPFSYIISRKPSTLVKLSAEEYSSDLIASGRDKARYAFEKAWETRNFEIEMYWRRATYFWAFLASTFVGYFALLGSGRLIEAYFIICIGFVLSVAWLLTNIGSKSWQRHWETHVDLLENEFTGPLYKTVHPKKTYSVSKINEIVSFMFVVIWLLIGAQYLIEHSLICCFEGGKYVVNWLIVISTIFAFLSVVSMVFGHGRGRFGGGDVTMYRRHVKYGESRKKA